MEEKQQNERLWYADFLRIIACAGVVVIHVCGTNWSALEPESFFWNVLNVYESMVRWCVPMFVMLSGMFFLDPRKKVTYHSLFFKNIFRIITAFFFWSAFYVGVGLIFARRAQTPMGWEEIKTAFLYGNYHQWFLFMVVGLYLITPVVRGFVKSAGRRDLEYFLGLCAVFTLIVPLFSGIPVLRVLGSYAERLNLSLLGGYVGFFVAGYYFRTYEFGRRARGAIYALGVLGFLVTCVGTYFASMNWQAPNEYWYGYLTPNVAAMSVALFVFFKNHVHGEKLSARSKKVLADLSRCTFGIYLVHAFLNRLLVEGFQINALSITPILGVPLITAAIMAVGYGIIHLLAKIPLFARYFM
ncbi:acyltransferase [Acidaminobacterium chupaoyuni]